MRNIERRTMAAISGAAYFLIQTLSPAKADILGSLFFPAQHIAIPFEAGRKGAVATTDYHASRDASFYFYLELKVTEDQSSSWEKVRTIAGSSATRNGIPIDNGLPIPVRLVILRQNKVGQTVIFDQIFEEERLESHSQQSFSKIISAVHLTRGDYKVKIEALEDIAELERIPADFDIHIPGNLK